MEDIQNQQENNDGLKILELLKKIKTSLFSLGQDFEIFLRMNSISQELYNNVITLINLFNNEEDIIQVMNYLKNIGLPFQQLLIKTYFDNLNTENNYLNLLNLINLSTNINLTKNNYY